MLRKADGGPSRSEHPSNWPAGEIPHQLTQHEAPEKSNPNFTYAGIGSTLLLATEDQHKA